MFTEFFEKVKKAFNIIKKDDVIEKLEQAIDDIKETIEFINKAQVSFTSDFPTSQEVKNIFNNFDVSQVTRVYNLKPDQKVMSIIKALENLIILLDTNKKIIKNSFNKEESVEALTYDKAALITTLNSAIFLQEYTMSLLNYIYCAELNTLSSLNEAQIKNINENLRIYIVNLRKLSTLDKLQKELESLSTLAPNLITADNDKTMLSLYNLTLESFSISNISTKYNPIYFIGRIVADVGHKKHECNKALLQTLQLMKLKLEKQKNNQEDANLDKQIQYNQERIKKLEYEISKYEKVYK